MTQPKRTVFKWFWRYAKPNTWLFYTSIIGSVGSSLLAIFIPFYYSKIFNLLAGDRSDQVSHALFITVVWIAGLSLLRWFLSRVLDFSLVLFENRVRSDMDQSNFAAILKQSYTFFADTFAGTLTRRVKRFSDSFENIIDSLVWNIISLVVFGCGALIVLFMRNAWLGLGMLVSVFAILFANVYFSRWRYKYDLKNSACDSEVSGAMTDAFTNNANIKSFARFDFERERFGEIRTRAMKVERFAWLLHMASASVQGFLSVVVEVAIILIAVRLWSEGKITIGDFAIIQAYLINLFGQLWQVNNVLRRVYQCSADAQEMADILDAPLGIKDIRSAKPLVVKKASIDLENMSFNYHKTRKTFEKFTLHVKPGERVALVGPSGAGKSTLVKLLLRFYDPDSGHILIDGQDIARATQESVRSQISFVPQDPVLFHRTLGENITYAKLDATQEDIARASALAHCHEFIDALPEKYETFVGERGIKLSGGERQRVAIARAILKDAPIILLDEATSSLDSESESLIQDALAKLMKGRTTIAIAHRLSTIMQMDRIIVLDGGKIVDEGTHDDLLKRDGLYRTLWNIQAGGFMKD